MMSFGEILALPLPGRCYELANFFDHASLKDLSDAFPLLINAIFGLDGSCGWRIREITRVQMPTEFDVMYTFFNPIIGPMFRLLYRLMGESLKYGLPLSYLPIKLQTTLKSGKFPAFYNGLVSVDPFQKQILGLLLSPFDYFLIHFAMHGNVPYRQMFPWGVPVMLEHERAKTLYFTLTAEYVCIFLPSEAKGVVLPQNVGSLIKSMASMVTPVRSPAKAIKYLLPQRLHHHLPLDQPEHQPSESARVLQWRSESALYIFMDIWLGMNVEEARELPSSELIRCVRVLVKQLHAFSNCSEAEASAATLALRQVTQPLISERMKVFLNSVFVRWPLDDSFIDVLELWLSYIQPWRYQPTLGHFADIAIDPKFEKFIAKNRELYTETFVALIRRLLKTDLTTLRNATLMFRLCKVFGQPKLLEVLREQERELSEHRDRNPSPSRDVSGYAAGSAARHLSYGSPRAPNGEADMFSVGLFTEETTLELQALLANVRVSLEYTRYKLNELQAIQPKSWIVKVLRNTGHGPVLRNLQDVVDRLEFAAATLVHRFAIVDDEPAEERMAAAFELSMSSANSSLLPPSAFLKDPALLPIAPGENAFLVRFLHLVSSKLSLMFGNEMERLWHRDDVRGAVARLFLMPPMTIGSFARDDSGAKVLTTEHLPARINLRFLSSYKAIVAITCSLLLGQLLLGAPSFGCMVLVALMVVYKIFAAALAYAIPVPPS